MLPKPPKTLAKSGTLPEVPLLYWEAGIIMDEPFIHMHFLDSGSTKSIRQCFYSMNYSLLPSDQQVDPSYQLTYRGLLDHLNANGPYYADNFNHNGKVAIFLRYPESKGGAMGQLLRYARIIRELGSTVTFYGVKQITPEWSNEFNYVMVPCLIDFWRKTTERVLMVSSVFDLCGIEFLDSPEQKRVLHICQGIETFHHGTSPTELFSEKILYDTLHSVQVRRIAVSEQIADYFKTRFSQDCSIIPNRINSRFDSNLIVERFKDSETKILWVGNPQSYLKGFDVLQRALHKLKKLMPISLTIASPVKEFNLGGLSDIQVQIKAGLSDIEMRDLYLSHDVLICSSHYEGFGLPVLEALSLGMPTVCTEAVATASILKDSARVVEIGDSEAIVREIKNLRENPELVKSLAENGKKVCTYFSSDEPDLIAKKVFKDIIGEPRKVDVTSKTFFSILMPTYNQAHYIEESIRSVLDQSFKDFELVICNDGSTDNTLEVLSKYNDPRIKVVSKKNGGTGSALNEALKHSTGSWICWLSSDDLYEPNALDIFKKAIRQNPSCRAFHAHYYFLHDSNKHKEAPPHQEWAINTPDDLQLIRLLEGNYFNGITVCIDRNIFEEVGYFNEANRTAQDYEMWLNIARITTWKYIPERTSVTRMHDAVGAVAFPEAGIYDSSLAVVRFLNKYEFPDYFPLLDLATKPEHAIRAFQAAIQTGLALDSYLYRAIGYTPLFLERTLEWFSRTTIGDFIKEPLNNIKQQISILPIPQSIKDIYFAICSGGLPGFRYTARDPKTLFINHLNSVQDRVEYEKLRKFGIKMGLISNQFEAAGKGL